MGCLRLGLLLFIAVKHNLRAVGCILLPKQDAMTLK